MLIGSGDGDDDTIINMQNLCSTVTAPPVHRGAGDRPSELRLRADVDDGAVMWINGTEVGRGHGCRRPAIRPRRSASTHDRRGRMRDDLDAVGKLVEGLNHGYSRPQHDAQRNSPSTWNCAWFVQTLSTRPTSRRAS